MAEAFLETAFEIKAMCDELSRRLLQWHWEKGHGGNLTQLAAYATRRAQANPEHYANVPPLPARPTWKQLDTTFCMRLLLEPNEGSEPPLRLLADAPRPTAARRACNGLRVARNAAAHATDLSQAAKAAATFLETVEDIAEGYQGKAIPAEELEKYRRAAAKAVAALRGRSGAGKTAAASAGKAPAKSKTPPSAVSSRAKTGAAKTSTANSKRTAIPSKARTGKKRAAAKKRGRMVWLILLAGALALALALWVRWRELTG